ncbi:MAG TPA: ABC transporter permease subunit [Acidimicrobiia bacterium]
MTATTLTRPPAPEPALSRAVDVQPVSWTRVLRSEWIKVRSLRSTVITLVLTVLGMVGLAMIAGAAMNSRWAHLDPFDRTPGALTQHLLGVVFLGQLAIGVLGVLFATGEYAHGMIRATLAAVPRRLPVLWAKVVAFAAVAFTVSLVATLASFLAGMALLGSHGVSLGAPGVWRAIIGAAAYLTVVGLMGLGLGFVLRSTAGAISSLFGVLLVLPALVAALPQNWQDHISRYLPMAAGQAVYTLAPEGASMGPWTGFALFCGYAAAAIALAAVSLRYRDA